MVDKTLKLALPGECRTTILGQPRMTGGMLYRTPTRFPGKQIIDTENDIKRCKQTLTFVIQVTIHYEVQ